MSKKESWQPFWLDAEKTWAVDFRVEGRRIRKRLPLDDKRMKSLARNLARKLYREAWEKSLEPSDPHRAVTFAEAARLYVESGGAQRFLPRIVDYFDPATPASSIDALEITRAAEALYPNAKPETVRRQLKVPIRAVQNFAAGRRRE